MKGKEFCESRIKSGKKVVIFSKSSCPFCDRVKQLFKSLGLSPDDIEIIELNQRDDCSDCQDYLASITGARSVPRVFINGKSIGGCDDTMALNSSGKLKQMLQ